MKPLGPVHTVHLFEDERALLLDALASLTREQWDVPTVCAGWSVKDIAAHLVADDLSAVSGGRDGYGEWFDGPWDELLAFINGRNEAWVDAMRRMSPQLVVELLRFSGERVFAQYRSRDLRAKLAMRSTGRGRSRRRCGSMWHANTPSVGCTVSRFTTHSV